MKPWERALQRDPMCAFVETVVDGYSPIDKLLCYFGRQGAYMRDHDPHWTTPGPTWPWAPGPERGSQHWYEGGKYAGLQLDAVAGELPWR